MSGAHVSSRPVGGFLWITGIYAVAVWLGALSTTWLPADLHPLWASAVADAVATIVVFAGSLATRNSSVYDPFWSVAPVALGLWFAARADAFGALAPSAWVALILVVVYGARLTWNWARGWDGLRHEDWRYRDIRQKTGRFYWLVSLLGIHGFPTVQTFLGSVPLYWVMRPATGGPLWLEVTATVVLAGAIVIEAVADEQLRAFRLAGAPGGICEVGLWSWSRHPNYFGEIGVWVGIALFGAAFGAPAWTWAGALAITAMFYGISIPLAETRARARRPAFTDYQRRVSRLIPMPPTR